MEVVQAEAKLNRTFLNKMGMVRTLGKLRQECRWHSISGAATHVERSTLSKLSYYVIYNLTWRHEAHAILFHFTLNTGQNAWHADVSNIVISSDILSNQTSG